MEERGWFLTLRKKLYRQLDLGAWHGAGVSPANRIILALIFLSFVSAALETEPSLDNFWPDFRDLNIAFAILFSIEFALRIWVKGEHPRYNGWRFRVRYVFRWHSLIDLFALALIWLELLAQTGGAWAVIFRLARIFRIFALTEHSKIGAATRALSEAIYKRRHALGLIFVCNFVTVMFFSSLLYQIEGEIQPDVFGSIPRAMWWAIVTLTSVGYGDAYPVTAIGRVVGACAAIASILTIALPSGVLAAAFSDAFRKAAEEEKNYGPDA